MFGTLGKTSFNYPYDDAAKKLDIHLSVSATIFDDEQPKAQAKVTLLIKCAMRYEGTSIVIQFPEVTTDTHGTANARLDRNDFSAFIDENFNLGMCQIQAKIGDATFDVVTSTYTGKPINYRVGVPANIKWLSLTGLTNYHSGADCTDGAPFSFFCDENTTCANSDWLQNPHVASFQDIITRTKAGTFTEKILALENFKIIKNPDNTRTITFFNDIRGGCHIGSLYFASNPSSANDTMDAAQVKAKCDESGAKCWKRYPNANNQPLILYNQADSTPAPAANEIWLYKTPNSDEYVLHIVQ